MVDLLFSVGRLALALFLVVLNGFFVAAEFAFVRVRSTSVEQLVEEGRTGSAALQDVMNNLDNYLAVTQLGITLASLGLGWAGEPAVASLIEPLLGPLLPESVLHLVAFGIGFGIITFLHVVFGELVPKTLAIAQAETLSLYVAAPMRMFYLVFYPGLIVFNGTANAFTRLLGVPPASETDESLKERELRRVLSRSGEAGHVDMEEVEMIERVFDLNDVTAREIMVPRPDVVSVPSDTPMSELRDTILDAGHTRYPVVDADDRNEVVGFVDTKDVLDAISGDEAGATTAGSLAHDVIVVPETMAVDDLLLQFRDEHQQMAVVIDEWGAFEGIATVEDVVETIVGDLRDTFDAERGEPSVRRRSDGQYDVDGGVPLSVVNDALGADFRSDGFETIGGIVLERLDRAPEPGDAVEVAGHVVEVTSVDGARISTVRVREGEQQSDSDDEEN
ncbi:hemolysin family protein [Halobacterium sp. R2-5]|uniref:hemolysin family protein n=1 Tax=Halobacterium sp. R2-5 TaxID=2715751 RepID=UPI001422596D|nr:hemolysin family protein [Halobacterium sp. R2-5]NIC00048.1 HlyC/CorC family transporter [Halobacterium sp. R2-5]